MNAFISAFASARVSREWPNREVGQEQRADVGPQRPGTALREIYGLEGLSTGQSAMFRLFSPALAWGAAGAKPMAEG
jgi:hypothetical protein